MRWTEPKIAGMLRAALVAAAILLQLLLIVLLVRALRNYAIYAYVAIEAAAIITIMVLVSRDSSSSYTIAWLLIICLLPVFGNILYFLWGRAGSWNPQHSRLKDSIAYGAGFLYKDPAVYSELGKKHPARKRTAGYLGRKNFPLYKNTACEYYPLGELQFDAMLKDIESAEKFIFLQYFILSGGDLWDRYYDALIRKAKAGVEVRLMFDDLGSIVTVSDSMIRDISAQGIKVVRFNPIHRYTSRLYLNYRNHQKITVVDGNIAYTGGTNLADEYANLYEKHGHWKDTAIRLEGDAVWSMTVTFLQMWDGETSGRSDYDAYRPTKSCAGEGFFQPFSDGPVNNPDNPAEVMYRSMIANAREYVYITTPYLVIDNTMKETLITAAESGADVRIITPKVWDHWYVHAVTQSNYKPLLKAGVKIYEYTPGYIHAKTILSDDEHAVTGSINMDYRSFYLHFENGVWICGDRVLEKIKQDFLDTCAVSEPIELERWLTRPLSVRFVQSFLRLFAVIL